MTPDAHRLTRLIFGCSGPILKGAERSFFRDANPFGFILFGRNIVDAAQLKALISDLRDTVGWHAPVLIDQEGGRVQRLTGPIWRDFPPPLSHVGKPNSERAFYLRGRLIAADLTSLGIDVNCTPTVDVARDDTHPFLQNRLYGWDAVTVITHAQAMVDGQNDGGVASVIKHIPGHGRGTKDSHLALPVVHAGIEDLQEDFKPFRALNGLSMGMSAHLIYTVLDADNPATQSETMIDLIRTYLGFNGLLMTDDISMEALSGTVTERSAKAIKAGCDLTLHCNGDMAEMEGLAQDTRAFEGPSIARAEHALKSRPTSSDIDISALWAEFMALVTETS